MRQCIFQGNSKVFDIDSYVTRSRVISWDVKAKKHQEEIKLDDKMFIWRTEGKDKSSLIKVYGEYAPFRKVTNVDEFIKSVEVQ